MATQDLVCLVAWDHLALTEAGDLLDQWEEWGLMAGVDLEVVLALHMGWVATQGLMAWVMALLMALHMASQIMAPDPMASLKDMASSPLLMVNNLLLLLTPLRVMVKHSSNLLDISHLNSLLTLSNLPIPNSQPTNLPTNNQPTLSSQPTHSHLHMVNNLPTLSSQSILKVLQLDLNRRPRGSVSSSVLKASHLPESS